MKPEPSPTSALPAQTCKNCGNQFTGYYCNLCGEKVLLPQDKSFKTFLSSIVIAITFADSKFIRTLWLMIKNPGFISREVADGRRVKYLRPLSVFFVLNLIYFLFRTIQLFNASLKTQLNSLHGKYAANAVALKMRALEIHDVQSFSLIYDQKTTGLAKMLVIVFVVLSSLPLNALYRSRNRYFTDHVGFAVELVCFNLVINALLLTLIVSVFGLGGLLDENILTGIFITTNSYFLLRASHTFYLQSGLMLLIKTVLMMGVLKVSLEIYRVILFYVTLWSL